DLGASGAAYATVIGQFVSTVFAILFLKRANLGFTFHRHNFKPIKQIIGEIFLVGGPIAVQDGLIQISFMIITVIANMRGLTDAASVGIVEKIISFMFLVPSALLSSISAITAQNMGAGKIKRANTSLRYGLIFVVSYGLVMAFICQLIPQNVVSIFTRDEAVMAAGARYLMSYSFDTAIAGIHFCFSGYFTGRGKSIVSFIHNMLSVILVRIPGAYLASMWFPEDLFPMGMAAPLGSALSAAICIGFYMVIKKNDKKSSYL
nr:MATE family efflux transporter [Lachnospiraceae bacterium]